MYVYIYMYILSCRLCNRDVVEVGIRGFGLKGIAESNQRVRGSRKHGIQQKTPNNPKTLNPKPFRV